MQSLFRDIGIRARLKLCLGSALLLGVGAGVALASGQRLALLPVLLAVASTLALGRWLGGHVERPVAQAIESVQAMLEGRVEHRPKIDKLDELGQLLIALDRLGDHLAVALPDEQLDGPQQGTQSPVEIRRTTPRHAAGDTTFEHLIDRLNAVCSDIDTHVIARADSGTPGDTSRLLQQRSEQLLKAAEALSQRTTSRQHQPV